MKGPRTIVITRKKPNAEMLKKRKVEIAKSTSEKASKKKCAANTKDPDAPKRPATAFFIFMEEFRKSFKENFPDNKSVSAVTKAGGEKWKSLSGSEKAVYTDKAQERKKEYDKAFEAYKKKKNGGDDAKSVESEKSSSEVHDEAEEEASS